MTVKPQHQIVAEQLNTLLDQVEQGPWDHYAAGRDREAIQAATALKDYAVRYKVVGNAPADDFDQLGQQIATAARTQAMQAGSDRATILAHLRTVLAQLSKATVEQAKKKSYDVNADLLAQVNHADQLGR